MINRSALKYYLKKILPRPLFRAILFIWQKALLHIVEGIDALRLTRFATYRKVELHHKGKTFSLFISPTNGFIDKYIYLYGIYEPFMLDLFTKHLKSGMTYIDIGANIGQHSMYVASLVGEKGAVYSFEPIPFIYNQLQDSVRANHFEDIVHAKNIALGKHESSEILYISRKNVGSSSLVTHEDESEIIIVVVKKGNEELAHIPSINVIKIDVEGYEYEVLAGIKETLLKHSPTIFLEFSGEIYNSQNKNHGAKILSLLRECKYTLYDIENDMKEIQNDKEYLLRFPHALKQTNLLCIIK